MRTSSKPHTAVMTEALLLGGGGRAPLAVCQPVAWNALATDPYRTWAFRRAQQVPFTTSPFYEPYGTQLVLGHIRSLPPTSFGVARLEAIAQALLRELLEPVRAIGQGTKVGVLLCLPERMGDVHGNRSGRAERAQLSVALVALLRASSIDPEITTVCKGNASLAFAVIQASNMLAAHEIEAAIIGGLETPYDPDVIQEWINTGRIYDNENPSTACPGEGGAFFLLAPRETAKRARWQPLAMLEGAATGFEPGHLYNDVPSTAAGMTQATMPLMDRMRRDQRKLDWWIHDMTNEPYRVLEMNYTMPRVAKGVLGPEGVLDGLHNQLGDLGAASMPTAVAIACEGFRRGAPRAATCLITGSSPYEDRGALLLAHV